MQVSAETLRQYVGTHIVLRMHHSFRATSADSNDCQHDWRCRALSSRSSCQFVKDPFAHFETMSLEGDSRVTAFKFRVQREAYLRRATALLARDAGSLESLGRTPSALELFRRAFSRDAALVSSPATEADGTTGNAGGAAACCE